MKSREPVVTFAFDSVQQQQSPLVCARARVHTHTQSMHLTGQKLCGWHATLDCKPVVNSMTTSVSCTTVNATVESTSTSNVVEQEPSKERVAAADNDVTTATEQPPATHSTELCTKIGSETSGFVMCTGLL
jgi:hypothetical protein